MLSVNERESRTGAKPAQMRLMAVLRDQFGFSSLRKGQAEAVGAVLEGRDVLAVMPTGAGKSLCYQLPALVLGGLTIVVSPLVALMRDQVAGLKLNGIAADAIHSDQSRDDNVAVWRKVRSGELRLLFVSPERLMTERMIAALQRLDVRLIAIDEAHCISQWGPAFRPDYEALSRLRDDFPGVPIIALTATADPHTQADIKARLFRGEAAEVITGFDRPNLSLAVTLKSSWKKQVAEFVDARRGQCGIVYCLSRRKTEEVAELLRGEGHNAEAFHAGLESADKTQIQNRFMTEPDMVVVATVAFGMGIDKPDVRYVLHTDLPASVEAYYQEIGRAGRDGKPAETMMLYGIEDIRMRRMFIEQEESAPERKRRETKRLEALLAYCEAPECRRQVLLRYFGEEAEPCGNCDNCLDPVPTVDGTAAARMVLAAVDESGERFGASHVVDILRGSDSEKILSACHDALPSFGIGVAKSRTEWLGIVRQMVAAGLLDIDISGYGGLKIAPRGQGLLRGRETFRYRPDRIGPAAGRNRRAAGGRVDAGLDPETADLLAALKALRFSLAKKRAVPAFVIFSDRTLVEMAQKRPRTLEEFARITGVGQAKARDFSRIFLEEIARHGSAAGVPWPVG